jgi:hypothetical protein
LQGEAGIPGIHLILSYVIVCLKLRPNLHPSRTLAPPVEMTVVSSIVWQLPFKTPVQVP